MKYPRQDALVRHLEAEGPQDARIGRAVARQDSQRFDPEVREYNDNRADAEAQELLVMPSLPVDLALLLMKPLSYR